MARSFVPRYARFAFCLLGCVLLPLLSGAGVASALAQSRAVASPTADPAQVRLGQATKVRFSADISDPSLIAGSVNLLRVGATGTNPAIVGVLRDDGTGGDEIAGDGRYSIELALGEPVAKRVAFRISAAFRGALQRTVTPDIPVDVVNNRAPVAIAGPNQAVRIGATVALDGRQSYDLDGARLTFRWALTTPAGSNAALDGVAFVKPTFSPDVAGSYTAQLVVNDGIADSVVRELAVQAYPAGGVPPTAVIGGARALPFGTGATTAVPLDGSGSFDPDGDPITFAWQLVGKPATSTSATLTTTSGATPSLIADKPGRYVVQLQVAAGGSASAAVLTTITLYQPNSPPTLDAGADRDVATSSPVALSASAGDVNGDPLGTPHWAFIAVPAGSTATLAGDATLTPSFTADVAGDYLLELAISDARGATSRARVLIRARGPADADHDGVPDASDSCPGTPPTVPVDARGCAASQLPPVTISALTVNPASGSAPLSVNFSSGATGGTGSYTYGWLFGDTQTSTQQNPAHTYTLPNTYNATVRATDTLGSFGEASATISVTRAPPVNTAPVVNAGAAQTITLPAGVALSGVVTDDGQPNPPGKVTLTWSKDSGPGAVAFADASAKDTTATFSAAGAYVLRLTASDGALTGFGTVGITVNPALPTNIAPIVNAGVAQTITLPAGAALSGVVTDDGLPNPPAAVTVTWSKDSGPGEVTFGNVFARSTTASFSAAGVYVLRLTANDGQLSASATVTITVNDEPGPVLPPDPSTVAPELDRTIATTVHAATAFLYTGSDPIQKGVAATTIDPKRVAVLRGKTLDRDGKPLTGINVTILGHPEFGTTRTRADGAFDMVVNGGGPITVRYEKAGYLPSQRRVDAPWQDYAFLPDVVLLPRDSQVTTINVSGGTSVMQVARGSVQADADGTRQATVLLPAGTTAALVQPDGSTRPVDALNVRLTEYTVGSNGQKSMPGDLPPTTGYTYAVELGVDESVAKVNGKDVVFSQPVILYVENFLGIPVGEDVPVGFYDPGQGHWIGSPNGRVVKVLGVTTGLAELDIDGDGLAEAGSALSAFGISSAERVQIAQMYAVGTSLWRTPLDHFSTADTNWGVMCIPIDCTRPKESPPPSPISPQCNVSGSIIGCERQTLGEAIELVGSPLTLHYQSDRVPGMAAEKRLLLSLRSRGLPTGVLGIESEVLVAGRRLSSVAPPDTETHAFEWDGNDAYGRSVQGSQRVTVRIGYVYKIVYARPTVRISGFDGISWALANGVPYTENRARSQITLWQEWSGTIGSWDARTTGLGGWTLSALHSYDPVGRVLHLGDGTRRDAETFSVGVISTIAGIGGNGFSGDNGPATSADIGVPAGLAAGSDGSLYFADPSNHRVRRIAPNGIISTVAGTSTPGFSGDGGAATLAQLYTPEDVAVGPDGSLYIADRGNYNVRKVRPDGTISTVAGNGNYRFSGDGGLATQAGMEPYGVAVGSEGELYIADRFNSRIRRVDAAGNVTTLAGTNNSGFSGDGGPANQARLASPTGVAVGPDGSIYVVDRGNNRIRKVSPQGLITTIAGQGGPGGFSGDGRLAVNAEFNGAHRVAVARDGSVYVTDWGNNRVRSIGTEGFIATLAGNGVSTFSGDGGPAPHASVWAPEGVAVGPDGGIYIVDSGHSRIRRVASAMPGTSSTDILIPSADGSEVFVFTGAGRHLRTLEALTGGLRYQFSYDSDGQIASVTDGDGNVTRVERTGGTLSAIVAPEGQRTTLTVNAGGWLSSITNPAGNAHSMTYGAEGLLSEFVDPRAHVHRFFYDPWGRLVRDEDPAGGFTMLSRQEEPTSYTVTTTSALGRTRSYQVEQLSTGEVRRTATGPSGTKTVTVVGTDGSQQTTDSTGTVSAIQYGPDPRWGMLAPIATNARISTPGGLNSSISATHTATLTDPNNPFALGAQSEQVVINGHAYTSSYVGASRTFLERTPLARQRTLTIDSLGRPVQSQLAGLQPVYRTYDGRGRLETVAQGSGVAARTMTLGYDSEGLLASVSDPLGRTTGFTYDLAGRVTRLTSPNSQVVDFTYDANGNVSSIVPPGRPGHAFAYTAVDLESLYTPPAAGLPTPQTQYAYNLDQQLTTVTRPDGQLVSFAYDAGGRLNALTTPTGVTNYAYGATSGKLTQITAPGATTSYTYDGALLLGETWGGTIAGAVTRTYNNDLQLSGLSVNGASVPFAYDADGLLTQVGDLTLTRSGVNGLLTATLLGATATSQSYDAFGDLSHLAATHGGVPILDIQYTRDAVGRIAQQTETISGQTVTSTYSYDPAGRLAGVLKNAVYTSYTYDGNGNRLSHDGVSGTYDDQDRLLTYGADVYTYTANGELKTKTGSGQATAYTYDVLGNLTSVTLPNGTIVDYVIDGSNRRIGKKVNGTLVQRWLYEDSLRPIAELDASNSVISRFVFATHVNVPEYLTKGGAVYRILTDHLGSPRLVVNTVTGAIVQRLDYDSFGNVLVDSNPGFQPFGFAGGLYDHDTGLVRFGGRDYDPKTGRWVTKDPIDFAGGSTNLYAYVMNDPLNHTDSTGLQSQSLPAFNEEKFAKEVGWRVLKKVLVKKSGIKPWKNPTDNSEYDDTCKISDEGKKGAREQAGALKRSFEQGLY